jgi:hypothetical protein
VIKQREECLMFWSKNEKHWELTKGSELWWYLDTRWFAQQFIQVLDWI